jgi:cytidylate kinase
LKIGAAVNGRASVIVIAMTREIGSRGTEVAAELANALGLKIIDSEIVKNQVAKRLGLEENTVRRYVEGSASLLERWQINKTKLSRYTTEEILALGQQGNVLIRGWGAAALFQDLPQVISVRVCAPLAFRERVLMERLGVTDVDAVRLEIERYDAAYVRTMRDSFGSDRDDALLYHIVLNTARVPIDAGVKAVCELVKNPWFQDDESLRSALADKLLETRVNAALMDQISISMAPSGVKVSAVKGKVTLTSTTSSGKLHAAAEQIVRKIQGVTEIDNRIISVPSVGPAQQSNPPLN